MSTSNELLRHLYGEEAGAKPPERLLADPAAREEYEALLEVKTALDGQPIEGPDPEVVARILAASRRMAPAGPPARADRLPARLARAGGRRWLAPALTAGLIAVVGLIIHGPRLPQGMQDAELRGVPADSPAFALVLPEAAPLAGEAPPAFEPALPYEEAAPAWDESEGLRTIYWRVEALERHAGGLSWDESPLPAEH